MKRLIAFILSATMLFSMAFAVDITFEPKDSELSYTEQPPLDVPETNTENEPQTDVEMPDDNEVETVPELPAVDSEELPEEDDKEPTADSAEPEEETPLDNSLSNIIEPSADDEDQPVDPDKEQPSIPLDEEEVVAEDAEQILPCADHPVTDFTILKIAGEGSTTPDGKKSEIILNIDDYYQHGNAQFTISPEYYFDSSQEIHIYSYVFGYGGPSLDEASREHCTNVSTIYDHHYVNGIVQGFYYDTKLLDIDPALSELNLIFTESNNTPNDYKTFTRKINLKFMDSRSQAPTTPHFILDPNNSEQFLLTGVDNTMEYRLNNSYTWTPCNGNNVPIPMFAGTREYQVRYMATENSKESKYLTLTLTGRKSSPTVAIDWLDESFTGLSTDMEYAIDNGTYTRVTQAMVNNGVTSIVDKITGTDPVTLSFRYSATGSTPASSAKTIKVYPRSAAPSAISLNTNTYVATGVSSSMQYMGPEDTKWKSISGSSVDLSSYAKASGNVTIRFRTKSTSTLSPSKVVSQSLPALAPMPSGLKLDFSAEKITGFQSGLKYQYSTTGKSFTNITLSNLTYSVSGMILTTSPKELYIRVAGSTTSRISAPWHVTLPQRPATPTSCKFIYNTRPGQAVLTGVATNMEYQAGASGAWVPCTGSTMTLALPASNITHNIRIRATANSFASNKKSITLYAPATAPTGTFNRKSETIAVSSSMEYKINNGSYTAVPQGVSSLPVTEYIEKLSGSQQTTLTLRYAVTETKPASKEKVITISARPSAPTAVYYSAADKKIMSAATTMEYRAVGSSTWTKVKSSSFSVESLVANNTTALEFRYASTSTKVASYTKRVNLS